MIIHRIARIATVIATLGSSLPSFAVSISLDFATLPSAQGWRYLTFTKSNEADVFSIDGFALHQNSIGTFDEPRYFWQGVVPHSAFDLRFRARLAEVEGLFQGNFSFGVKLRADNFWIDVGLGLGRVEVQENSRRSEYFSLDTSEFHNYRVLGNPEAGSYSFFIDEIELISSRSIGHTSVNINFLSFGDHISAFNGFPMGARADLASFTFAPIPEPTIIWLFLSGLGLLIAQYARPTIKELKYTFKEAKRGQRGKEGPGSI